MKKFIIESDKFKNYDEAYRYIKELISEGQENKVITIREVVKKYIDSTDDCEIVWVDSNKAKEVLGYKETTRYLRLRLQSANMNEISEAVFKVKQAEKEEGDTLFDLICNSLTSNGAKLTLK